MPEQLVVLLHCLCKSESGVENPVADAEPVRFFRELSEIVHDRRSDPALVVTPRLHVRRYAFLVHRDVFQRVCSYASEHQRVIFASRYVIDRHLSYLVECSGYYVPSERVYRDFYILRHDLADRLQHGLEPFPFVLCVDAFGARTGRARTDVNVSCALFHHIHDPFYGLVCQHIPVSVHIPAVGIERVRCDVDNSHNLHSASAVIRDFPIDVHISQNFRKFAGCKSSEFSVDFSTMRN